MAPCLFPRSDQRIDGGPERQGDVVTGLAGDLKETGSGGYSVQFEFLQEQCKDFQSTAGCNYGLAR